jgi:glycine oxidase
VLGPAGLPGLVLATGHFRAGVLLAPVTADTVAAYLSTGTPDPLWQAFGAGRFTRPGSGDRHSNGGHRQEEAVA